MILEILTPAFFTLWILSIWLFGVLVDLSNLPIAHDKIGGCIGLTILFGIFFFIIMGVCSLLKKDRNILSNNIYTKIYLIVGALILTWGSVGYYFYRTWELDNYKPDYGKAYLPNFSEYKEGSETGIQEAEKPKHGYQSAPIIQSKSQSYFISGRTREDLCNAVLEWQEKHNKGRTLAFIDYNIIDNYYTIYTDRGYTVGFFTVTADSTITVPQWSSSEGASDGTKSDWNSFKNAIASHEREHKDILIEYAQKLVNAYNNMGYFPTESVFKASMQNTHDSVYSQMENAQKDFDNKYGESKSFSYLCR